VEDLGADWNYCPPSDKDPNAWKDIEKAYHDKSRKILHFKGELKNLIYKDWFTDAVTEFENVDSVLKSTKFKRGIIFCAFNRNDDHVNGLLSNIRSITDLPVTIYSDQSYNLPFEKVRVEVVTPKWQGQQRAGIKNSNLWKAKGCLFGDYDSTMAIDDDMRIVHPKFTEGFDMADHFGLLLPINPRTYQKFNKMGDEVTAKHLQEIKDLPDYATCWNFSPMFTCIYRSSAVYFLELLIKELEREDTHRGTVALWKAAWETSTSPFCLPLEWCVCQGIEGHCGGWTCHKAGISYPVEPIMLHCGHKEVKDFYIQQPAYKEYLKWDIDQIKPNS
jgi:hypothetical protein